MVLPAPPELTESERKWLMTTRQTLIMRLGAVEERLGMERSIVPKRKKGNKFGKVVDGSENAV